jgi:hypothetical protein
MQDQAQFAIDNLLSSLGELDTLAALGALSSADHSAAILAAFRLYLRQRRLEIALTK